MGHYLSRSLVFAMAFSVCLAALGAAPARAQFPESWSIVWFDITGFPVECTDLVPCRAPSCPANMFFSGHQCRYSQIAGDFEPGKTRTQIVCSKIFFGGFFFARVVTMEVTCSRFGEAFWGLDPGTFGPGTCAALATYHRIWPTRETLTEGFSGATIAGLGRRGAGTCADWAFSPAAGSLRSRGRLPRQ